MKKFLSTFLWLPFALALAAGDAPKPALDTNQVHIAQLTSRILAGSHYSQHPFDKEMSGKFLDRYVETLDGLHLHFFLLDLQEFEIYRNHLDELTKRGDTTPARVIMTRLLQRIDQRVAYVNELLKSEKFDFAGHDRYAVNRKDQPRPRDLDEAKELWREHLRYEYLQEKLAAPDPAKATAKAGTRELPVKPVDVHAPKKGSHEEIVKTLTTRYSRLQRTFKELSDDEIFEIYLTALAHAYDPHSDYMGREQMENFAISMRLSLFGIGALLRSEDGYCKIEELKPGPAMMSKQLKPGDRIVAVAQNTNAPVDVVDMKLQRIVEMIRGEKGTEVTLTVIPVDAPDPATRKTVKLVRAEIKLEDQEAKARIIEMPAAKGAPVRLGVIDLPSFYEDFESRRGREHKSTTADVLKLLKKLNDEHVQGVVLDLRRNGGGALNEAINLTGLFIKKGPVVQTRDPDGTINVDADNDPSVAYDGPLIVLTSRFSASASEILAGALQDYGRALIIGDKSTHGKGTVQSLLSLDPILRDNGIKTPYDPGALKITIRKFYRASGSSTQLKGVVPDLVLPSVNNYAEEVGEAALKNPLDWDEVAPAHYERLNLVQPYLAELKSLSNHRVQTEKDFDYVRQDIEQYKKLIADKSVSLNEQERVKEQKEVQASIDARQKERKARKPTAETVYEITLRNAELPGLPAPTPKTNEVALAEIRPTDPADELAEDKAPAVDVTLEETKRILIDYIKLATSDVHAKLTQSK